MFNKILEALIDFAFGRWIALYSSVSKESMYESE